jgi:hypothetical protein
MNTIETRGRPGPSPVVNVPGNGRDIVLLDIDGVIFNFAIDKSAA